MRVNGKCIGDCSKCQLLAAGEVDMIPCILDQIFQRLQRNEHLTGEIIAYMKSSNEKECNISIAGGLEEDLEEDK